MKCVLDLDTGQFVQWEDRLPQLGPSHTTESGLLSAKKSPFDWLFDNIATSHEAMNSLLTATPQLVQSAVVLAMLLQQGRSAVVTGNSGSGKSMFLRRCLRRFCRLQGGVESCVYLMRNVLNHGSASVAEVLMGDCDQESVDDTGTSPWTSTVTACMSGTTSKHIKKLWLAQVHKKHKMVYWPLAGKKKVSTSESVC